MNHRTAVILLFLVLGALTALLALTPGPEPSHASAPGGLTPTVEPPTPTPGPPCVGGKKIDDLHVGLPGWTIHARPCGADGPVLTTVTDGSGNFLFTPLAAGCWTIWEEQQPGWAPVTPWTFDLEVLPGNSCAQVRFKNRQSCAVDLYEPDNSPAQARRIAANDPAEKHTLEPPSDLDYVSFDAVSGWTYTLRTSDLIGATDTVLVLYGPNGATVLAMNDDESAGTRTSRITWQAPAAGRYFVMVRDLYQTGLNGCLGYQLTLTTPGRHIYVPLVLIGVTRPAPAP